VNKYSCVSQGYGQLSGLAIYCCSIWQPAFVCCPGEDRWGLAAATSLQHPAECVSYVLREARALLFWGGGALLQQLSVWQADHLQGQGAEKLWGGRPVEYSQGLAPNFVRVFQAPCHMCTMVSSHKACQDTEPRWRVSFGGCFPLDKHLEQLLLDQRLGVEVHRQDAQPLPRGVVDGLHAGGPRREGPRRPHRPERPPVLLPVLALQCVGVINTAWQSLRTSADVQLLHAGMMGREKGNAHGRL
jgi:hypothetical protein